MIYHIKDGSVVKLLKRFALIKKVGKTKIIPLGLKILLIAIFLILLSNFATNFISLQLSQRQIINLSNTIMVAQLKELYTNSSNQYQIYTYSNDRNEAFKVMKEVAASGFENPHSIAMGFDTSGKISILSSNSQKMAISNFSDKEALSELNAKYKEGIREGSLSFNLLDGEYFGIYKWQPDWNMYLVRAEKRSDISANTRRVFSFTSIIILCLTVLFVIIGYIIINKEFAQLHAFTQDLFDMQKKKQLGLIDISKASNDDITYMAASFNSLSSSVNNLLHTFQKFVSKDVVAKAYSEQEVLLEGTQQELTMLFSDIKSFTYRTETLGNDIIDVLNVHYNKVINKVHVNNGVIGSIIGDAILAVYGTLGSQNPKSLDAVISAWDITRVTANLRAAMIEKRAEIEKTRNLTESEEKIFKAVLLDVGVGIDGGNVFYGNIGSNEHMANTVIGDNVNSASRLEGLTRIYHLPVIVSGYIKDEVEKVSQRYRFFEIDTVQVKGKTEGKKIYFPFDCQEMDNDLLTKYELFEEGLTLYYQGEWKKAVTIFKSCELDVTEVFLERMGTQEAPEDWRGIWTMTTK